jgi:hypothetical protein
LLSRGAFARVYLRQPIVSAALCAWRAREGKDRASCVDDDGCRLWRSSDPNRGLINSHLREASCHWHLLDEPTAQLALFQLAAAHFWGVLGHGKRMRSSQYSWTL